MSTRQATRDGAPVGRGRANWVAGLLLAVATAVTGAAAWLVMRHGLALADAYVVPAVALLDLAAFYAFAVVGAVVATRRPVNPIGWLLLAAGTGFTIQEAVNQYAGHAYSGRIPMTQLAVVADWLSSWLWIVFVIALGYVLLLFPDGNLPSRRWRWVGRSIAATGVLLLLVPVATWQARSPAIRLMDFWPEEGPTPDALVWSLNALIGLLLALVVVAAVSLIVRFRRSADVERQQLRWIAAAGAGFIGLLVLGVPADRLDSVPLRFLVEVGGGLAIAGVPVAIGLAVLRYRLFDLDRIISRTVGYGLVTLVIAAVYVASVVGLGAIVRSTVGGSGSDLVVAASTLLAAAAFGPVRRRTQAAVDRRFNRAGYDAQRTVEAFTHRLRDEVDLDALARDLRELVGDTFHPTTAALWLREARTDDHAHDRRPAVTVPERSSAMLTSAE